MWCQHRIEADGRRVLYGDTDSLFVETGATEPGAAQALGETLTATLNRDLARHIADTWRVTSRLDLVFDRLYLRRCLPAMRHGTAGARTRYAGSVEAKDGARVAFTGMCSRVSGSNSAFRSSNALHSGVSSRITRTVVAGLPSVSAAMDT